MNFKTIVKIYTALLENGIIYWKGGEMDFPCSVNTSMYATSGKPKKAKLLSTVDNIIHFLKLLLFQLKLMTTFKFSIIMSQPGFNAAC